MKNLLSMLILSAILMASGTTVRAQEAKGFRSDMIGQIMYAQKEILELENAIPDKKMTWRPNKEVRSISEVYSHLAFGNYLFAKSVGIALPAGVEISSPGDETKWEKASTDKKVIHEQLVKSFDFIRGAINNMSDASLENTVEFFGQKMSVRAVLMANLAHMNQHLGQSIAYARMIGVVPPWTAAQMAPKPKM